MSEKLYIPAALQLIFDEIEAIELNLGEVPIEPHPMISVTHERFLRIYKIIPDLEEIPRTDVYYCQVLKTANGEIIPSNLPNPEWTIHSTEYSTFRNAQNQRVMLPVLVSKMKSVIVDEGLETEHEVDVLDLDENGHEQFIFKLDIGGAQVTKAKELNSHKYLVWLVKNNKAGLVDLLSGYLEEKILTEPDFKSKLDQLK